MQKSHQVGQQRTQRAVVRHHLHQLPPDHPITSFTGPWRWLSNFWPSPISVCFGPDHPIHGAPTVEHAYQAMKCEAPEAFYRILLAATPAQARSIGRRMTRIVPDWDQIRVGVMRDLILLKFDEYPALAEKLIATGTRELIEGNTWGDEFWGMVRRPVGTRVMLAWKGENWLGRILMERRAVLQKERGR